jgi:aminopeptidase N
MNLGDWYPFVPSYREGQGWLVADPSVVGEHLSYDVADYQVEIAPTPPQPNLVIAASAPFDAGTRQYRIDAARSFAWSASTKYRVLTGSSRLTAINAYIFPEHLVAGQAALQATIDALEVYSNQFAPYPHAGLTLVEVDFPDGMEYSGLYFLGQEYYAAYDGTPQNYLIAIAAHETAHQWWYGLVSNDQAGEPWLDEALATYSELLFYETTYPDLTDWWWEFRVKRFQPVGWVNSTIYDHSGFRSYVDAVYLRGALFMDELRRSIGDEAFLAFLKDYVGRGSFAQLTGADFFAMLAKHTTVDLESVISRYFHP